MLGCESEAEGSGLVGQTQGEGHESSWAPVTVLTGLSSRRYRNFRTFTSPRPTQFSCVAVNSSGDIVSAGAQDSFEILIWSMQTGRLLDVRAASPGAVLLAGGWGVGRGPD